VTPATATPQLRRVLGFRDLFLFYVVTTFSLRWVGTAAAAGPTALVIWIIAALGLYVPLVFTVLELSSRYPEEGGVYVWSKRAFGPFSAFITGWTYWGSNLPYFPGLLYFAAANALFLGGPAWQSLSSNSTYFILVAMTGLAIAVTMNVLGLNVGKWLNNVGAIAGWIGDCPWRGVLVPVRDGDADERADVGAEHEPERRHLLVHHCVRLRRRRKRIDDGRGD
jgi:amino acid transporter